MKYIKMLIIEISAHIIARGRVRAAIFSSDGILWKVWQFLGTFFSLPKHATEKTKQTDNHRNKWDNSSL